MKSTTIRVLWKNIALMFSYLALAAVTLSSLSVPRVNVGTRIAIVFGFLLLVLLALRAYRQSIELSGSQVILRKLVSTKRIERSKISGVEVAETAQLLAAYYLTFNLRNGNVVKMKGVFLWKVSGNSKSRVQGWLTEVNRFLNSEI